MGLIIDYFEHIKWRGYEKTNEQGLPVGMVQFFANFEKRSEIRVSKGIWVFHGSRIKFQYNHNHSKHSLVQTK